MTKVINIKDAPEGWRNNPDYVYIGRGSIFGNPVRIGEHIPGRGEADRNFVISWYRAYILVKILTEKGFRDAVMNLKGKILVCFCKPLLCHGDILVEFLGD